ncbi:MAG: peptidoglycan-binding protein [Chitinophagales bacterium]|nr:peptidoglycan-binding protein [Chitinophagales bacterium]
MIINRKFNLAAIVFVMIIAASVNVNGQIYIDTGHPDVEKLKEENKDLNIYEGVDENKEPVSDPVNPTTPTIETKPEEATPKTKVVEESTTQPTNKVTKSEETKTAQKKEKLMAATDDLPPNAEKGKCYARCYVPDQFKYVDEMVIDKPVSYKTQVVPATYKTITETIIVRPESKRTETVPAEYEYVTEEIMVAPSSTQWVKKMGDPTCLSADPEDCQVMCLEDVPAKYKTVRRRVMKTPSFTREITTPAATKIVTKEVLVAPAKTEKVEVPATYKKVLKKVKVKDGGYQAWREVLCGDQITSTKIRQIQLALKAKGYDPGPVDNILGPQTRAALTNYQHDKGLPVGNLNIETMKSLGVE